MHEQWMARHSRAYKDLEEKEIRYQIFRKNVELIMSFNRGKQAYKLGTNAFADMTDSEVGASRNGSRPSKKLQPTPFMYSNVTNVPWSVDWRNRGAVTSVKEQRHCGACWAFTVVASIEGIIKITTDKLVTLSVQELVDCNIASYGCGGGYFDGAFSYIVQNGGITSEANYPYTAQKGTCNAQKRASHAARIRGYQIVPPNSEEELLKAVSRQPVAVYIDSSAFQFKYYRSGIFTGPCGTIVDHCVTVEGYGSTADGTKYWLVKNSWSSSWGENGYMRMRRDVNAGGGLCGITMSPFYPIA